MTTVTGPERLFALEARSPAKPEALRLLEIEKTTNHSGRHLSRNQNNTSSEGAHLHLWCIAHRCAAVQPLLSRRASGLRSDILPRSPSEPARRRRGPGIGPRSHRSPSETLPRRRSASTNTQQSERAAARAFENSPPKYTTNNKTRFRTRRVHRSSHRQREQKPCPTSPESR